MFPIRDTIPSRTYPVMTLTIILANAAVFLFELGLSEDQLKNMFFLFGFIPARYSQSTWAAVTEFPTGYWPFFTSMFLHGGWLHIIFNMWSLWIFGDNVEDRMGHIRFLVFYVLCGIAAGIMHLFTSLGSTLPTVGASGAIAGVMGAYFLLYPYARIITMIPVFFYPVFIEVPAVIFIGLWLYSQLFSGVASLSATTQVGGIAWWAHVGGFMAGAVLTHFFVKRHR
ncbi:MAG: rhomboid family intramembrane serine protease [Deltaproteobacteria bacterium]|nr:rhomboid family intramembrane serine protease [Deltaproteobacteria bacterium]